MQKFIIVFAAVFAVVAADVSHLGFRPSNEYLPPFQQGQNGFAPSNEYLPPYQQGSQGSIGSFGGRFGGNNQLLQPPVPFGVDSIEPAPAHTLGADGYRYKAPVNNALRF